MSGLAKSAPVICIDGPGGSGKGTVAMRLARELGWHYLDSGALYRACGLFALQRQLPFTNSGPLARAVGKVHFETVFDPNQGYRISLDGVDVSDEIRSERCAEAASQVGRLQAVRAVLLQQQRQMARLPGLVAEGRDMGTVVFPAAEVKIHLTASLEKRAERRYKQLKEKGMDVSLDNLLSELGKRDLRDRTRAAAPLRPAADAVIVDSTGVSIEGVMERVRQLVTARLSPRSLGGGVE